MPADLTKSRIGHGHSDNGIPLHRSKTWNPSKPDKSPRNDRRNAKEENRKMLAEFD